jgi:hypothetical protein
MTNSSSAMGILEQIEFLGEQISLFRAMGRSDAELLRAEGLPNTGGCIKTLRDAGWSDVAILSIPDMDIGALSMMGGKVTTMFECPECEYEWPAPEGWVPRPWEHPWQSCPACGGDDGENCWDCGVSVEEHFTGFVLHRTCMRSLCPDCQSVHHTVCGNSREIMD